MEKIPDSVIGEMVEFAADEVREAFYVYIKAAFEDYIDIVRHRKRKE